ncbi:MAG: hypothetical protein HQL40_07555 [Alphaproteobacteria bacterium]|nr:hypothetical protein [Alphaproteobacteria bacterium]
MASAASPGRSQWRLLRQPNHARLRPSRPGGCLSSPPHFRFLSLGSIWRATRYRIFSQRCWKHPEKSGVRQPHEVHFLGFSFRCSKEDQGDTIAVFLSRKAERRLRETVRALTPPNWGRSVNACMAEISRYLTGWVSYFRLCTAEATYGFGVVDAHIRRRVRAIIVRQKKRARFLFRHLIGKAVSPKAAANCAYCGRGAWVKSNRRAMTRAYPPAWFAGRMVSIKARWFALNSPPVSAQLSLAL